MAGDTPPLARGERYSTHLTQRCLAYKKCMYCQFCENFDSNSAMCQYCEGRKKYKPNTCTCGAKKYLLKQMEEHFGRPLNPGDNYGTGEEQGWSQQIALDTESETLMEQVHKEFNNVGVKVVDMSEKDTGGVRLDY